MKIRGIRILDPVLGTDSVSDLYVDSVPWDSSSGEIDGARMIAMPAAVDLHAHFREPGDELSETLETGVSAAMHGGFGAVVTMPNTTPAVDTADALRFQISGERFSGGMVKILPAACCTIGRKGVKAVDPAALGDAAAFSDDGNMVADDAAMLEVMRLCAASGRLVMDHAVNPLLAGRGVIRDCETARKFDLPLFSDEAETSAIIRDCRLASETGCRVHIQHVSCGDSVKIIRDAKALGCPVSAEATPHHLLLAAEDIPGDNPNWKMNPPLGIKRDVRLLRAGIADGTLDCFATDHAPHSADRKAKGFAASAFGVTGIETALPATWAAMVSTSLISPVRWAQLWTVAPSSLIGLRIPSITEESGCVAALLEMRPWTVSAADFRSKSANSPYVGMPLPFRVLGLAKTL